MTAFDRWLTTDTDYEDGSAMADAAETFMDAARAELEATGEAFDEDDVTDRAYEMAENAKENA